MNGVSNGLEIKPCPDLGYARYHVGIHVDTRCQDDQEDRKKVMAEAGMTKLYWYETEMDKLEKLGYASGEAHKIVMGWLSKMEGVIEWWEIDWWEKEVEDV
jgi:hypothetical protein